MTPIAYPNSVTYAKNQSQYLPLPCIKEPNGDILISWKLTFRERIKLLFTGILYHKVRTFNYPLQPISLTVDIPSDVISDQDESSANVDNNSNQEMN